MARISDEAKAETRIRLLEAAAAEFARCGLDGANVNEISLAAGLGKGTVYNYFDSKQELFLAVIEEACARAAADSERVPAAAPTAARLRGALEADMDWVRANADFARVFVREVGIADPELYPRIIAAAGPFVRRVEQILADGVERGEVRGDVPLDRLALMFTGLGDLALRQHWGSGADWPTLDEIPDLVTEMFLNGAAPGGASAGVGASGAGAEGSESGMRPGATTTAGAR